MKPSKLLVLLGFLALAVQRSKISQTKKRGIATPEPESRRNERVETVETQRDKNEQKYWTEQIKIARVAAVVAVAAIIAQLFGLAWVYRTLLVTEKSLENFKLDQTAWVGVVDANPPDPINLSAREFSVVFTNSGKTPARELTISIFRDVLPSSQKPVVGVANREQRNPPPNKHVIHPQAKVVARSEPITITDVEMRGIKDK